MHDRSSSIQDFLSATAARQPAPGGGSVTALVGALAVALGEMTLNYSIGKKDLLQHEPILRSALDELHRARELLMQLMVEDQAAYETLTAIRKLPSDSPDRATRLPAATLTCIRVPQSIGATAVAILVLCERVVDVVNPYLLSDLAVCAELAMATTRCAIYNCRVNLSELSEKDRRSINTTTDQLHAHALGSIRRVIPKIWSLHAEIFPGQS